MPEANEIDLNQQQQLEEQPPAVAAAAPVPLPALRVGCRVGDRLREVTLPETAPVPTAAPETAP